MEIITINSNNTSTAEAALTTGGKYFIISTDLTFTNKSIRIGDGSILEFRGGSFSSNAPTTLDLNSSPIIAGAYPIFGNNIKVKGLAINEVRAEWFRSAEYGSDDEYINEAITAANGAPVLLEYRTYTLKNSIKFIPNTTPQTLICPGTLHIDNADKEVPAIDINAQTVNLKINKIIGNKSTDNSSDNYSGAGVKFSVYIQHSNIEVTTMSELNKGFFVQPDVRGQTNSKGEQKSGGVQYCRIKFGSILADYCFYIDVYTTAAISYSNGEPIDLEDLKNRPSEYTGKKLSISNWFNENQISGELMQGQYGIYTIGNEDWEMSPDIQTKFGNLMNGMLFENISFERITGLAVRLRDVMRSSFLNMQMYNSMPGGTPNDPTDTQNPWIDIDNTKELKMTFRSFVLPHRVKSGSHCVRCYLYGAILDDPANYSSHFDTLGIDAITWYDSSSQSNVQISQMFVTNSVVPYNMAKTIVTTGRGTNQTEFISGLLPNLKDGSVNEKLISLPVLPSTLNVDIKAGDNLVLNLSGLQSFAPCLYTINATIASGSTLTLRSSDSLRFEQINSDGSTTKVTSKSLTTSGVYSLQWLNNWVIRVNKI